MKVNGVTVDVKSIELTGEDLIGIFVSVARDKTSYGVSKALICQFIDEFCSTHDEDVVELGAEIISSIQMCRLACGNLSETDTKYMRAMGFSDDDIDDLSDDLSDICGGDYNNDDNA